MQRPTFRSSVCQDSLMQRRAESDRDASHLVEMMSISTAWDNRPIQHPVYFVYITLEDLPVMDVGWCRELTWNQKFLSSKDWSLLTVSHSPSICLERCRNPIQKLMTADDDLHVRLLVLYYTVWILKFSCAEQYFRVIAATIHSSNESYWNI